MPQVLSNEDKLKLVIGLKPKVIQDFTAIQEKFPCNPDAQACLKHFVIFLNIKDHSCTFIKILFCAYLIALDF